MAGESWRLGPRPDRAVVRSLDVDVDERQDNDGWEERSEMRGPHKVRWLERPVPGGEATGRVQRVYLESLIRDSEPVGTISLVR